MSGGFPTLRWQKQTVNISNQLLIQNTLSSVGPTTLAPDYYFLWVTLGSRQAPEVRTDQRFVGSAETASRIQKELINRPFLSARPQSRLQEVANKRSSS